MSVLLPGNTSMHTWFKLTTRQQQVTSLVCLGLTNGQVARELTLSQNTVKVHIKEAMRKFEVNNRADLCEILLQTGLEMRLVYEVLSWNTDGSFPKLPAQLRGVS
jgi:DNA-binding NarL/FixJ family response regulator